MKNIKLKFSTLAILAVGILMTSCNKSKIEVQGAPVAIEQELGTSSNKDVVTIYWFTWDGWGRKSKDCDGGGLCNFRLEEIEIGFNVAPVYTDTEGNSWVDIEITDGMPAEYDYAFFPVDEDIISLAADGETFVLPAGLYPLDESIGSAGGYKLPLIQQ